MTWVNRLGGATPPPLLVFAARAEQEVLGVFFDDRDVARWHVPNVAGRDDLLVARILDPHPAFDDIPRTVRRRRVLVAVTQFGPAND